MPCVPSPTHARPRPKTSSGCANTRRCFQGIAGKEEHLLLNPTGIPVVKTDRGGQITYHGPGQTMVYVLLDLRRAGYGVRELVQRIERGVIAMLASHGVTAYGKRDAPGVYVRPDSNRPEAKIASLGLKVRNGCTYHGVAFNVAMDLAPFVCINPAVTAGLRSPIWLRSGHRARLRRGVSGAGRGVTAVVGNEYSFFMASALG